MQRLPTMSQAKTFKEVADISGIVLTKADGTASYVIAIKNEIGILLSK